MKQDISWVETWSKDLIGKKVLELGCGAGIDTEIIRRHSSLVVSTDILDHGTSATVRLDHSQPLPFLENKFDVVVASLCLHYFSWRKTSEIVEEIARVLSKDGLLICRVNSTNDKNYGAVGSPEIEPNMYRAEGKPKRFFDRSDIEKLFSAGWCLLDLKESCIDRYQKPKEVWEFGAVNT